MTSRESLVLPLTASYVSCAQMAKWDDGSGGGLKGTWESHAASPEGEAFRNAPPEWVMNQMRQRAKIERMAAPASSKETTAPPSANDGSNGDFGSLSAPSSLPALYEQPPVPPVLGVVGSMPSVGHLVPPGLGQADYYNGSSVFFGVPPPAPYESYTATPVPNLGGGTPGEVSVPALPPAAPVPASLAV
jgi:hypothetical protein